MNSLTELCDLIAQNPTQFPDKIDWICNRCPPPDSLSFGSPKISLPQLNAILITARFLSKCGNNYNNSRPRTIIIDFIIKSIPASFDPNFWPDSFNNTSIATFYVELFGYVSKAAEYYPDSFGNASDVARVTGEVMFSAVNDRFGDLGVSRAFLSAAAESFPPVGVSDGNKLVSSLLDGIEFVFPCGGSPKGVIGSSSSSPVSVSNVAGSSSSSGGVDEANSKAIVVNGNAWGIMGTPNGSDRRGVGYFEEESVESLEKQEIAFKLISQIVERLKIDSNLLERVHVITKDQLKSVSSFLKIRKRDWTEQGSLLKARINTKLSVYKAAVKLKIAGLLSLDSDGKLSKKLLTGALALLVEAAEACVYSIWRKLRVCEDLFSSLLDGISKIAVAREGYLLRVLFIRFKPLVQATCAQADTWASSQGAMFESVLKSSCEIIQYGWTKDPHAVDTFIKGLAANIRKHNDYEEEDVKEKQAVPLLQLNIIKLLAELNIQVKKAEIVDIILPLFIESLEEGDASTPGLLRLRVMGNGSEDNDKTPPATRS